MTVGRIPYILNSLPYEVVAVNKDDIPPSLVSAWHLPGRKHLQQVTKCMTGSARCIGEWNCKVRFWLVCPKTVSTNQASPSLNASLYHALTTFLHHRFTLGSSPSSSTHIYNISTYSEGEHCSFAFADTRPYYFKDPPACNHSKLFHQLPTATVRKLLKYIISTSSQVKHSLALFEAKPYHLWRHRDYCSFSDSAESLVYKSLRQQQTKAYRQANQTAHP